MAKASEIITRVRRMLDQIPLSNEDVRTDSAVIGSPSTNFSDENLLERINNGQREIISRVKAQHVPLAVTEYTGPFPNIEEDIVRLLYSRVMYDESTRALQRSVDRHRRLEQAGRQATSSYPVYTYEDEELNIYPDDDDAAVAMVVVPDDITVGDITTEDDDLTIDERTHAALIFFVIASCFQTMRQPDLYAWAIEEFLDELDPYVLQNRYNSLFDDREVDVE